MFSRDVHILLYKDTVVRFGNQNTLVAKVTKDNKVTKVNNFCV